MRKSDHLSTAQVAEELQVSVATVNRWAVSGRLTPALQVPGITGARLYSPDDVERMRQALTDRRKSA